MESLNVKLCFGTGLSARKMANWMQICAGKKESWEKAPGSAADRGRVDVRRLMLNSNLCCTLRFITENDEFLHENRP